MKTIKVKIREWDDMEKEFGLDKNGSIECKYRFLDNMNPLCGKMVELYFDEDFNSWREQYTNKHWYIYKDMVEPEYRHLMEVE